MKALFDTNILIDFLRGVPAAREEFNRYEDRAISVVTWMEIMVCAPASAELGTRDFLAGFVLVGMNEAVALRRQHRLKLPEAIVWASVQVRAMLLIAPDSSAFPADDPGVRMPYRV